MFMGDRRDESFEAGYQRGYSEAIKDAALRAELADSPQAAAVAIRALDPQE